MNRVGSAFTLGLCPFVPPLAEMNPKGSARAKGAARDIRPFQSARDNQFTRAFY